MLTNDQYTVIHLGGMFKREYRATCSDCDSVIETTFDKLTINKYTDCPEKEDCPMCSGIGTLQFERHCGE